MKKLIYGIIIIGLFILGKQFLLAQPTGAPPVPYILESSCMGTEFWVAIPLNEDPNVGLKNPVIEIVVSSNYNTNVNYEVPDLGITRTKPLSANSYVSFSSKKGDLQTLLEITESDQVTNKGIHITSEKPISVYVVNYKQYSAEAYMAIPVAAWGTNYYHCSYYDFYEKGGWGVQEGQRGGGFICMAAENNTKLNITLNGKGGSVAKCLGGKKIGAAYSVSLNKGQTYMIMGDGTTKGQFDISGTKITGNKPFGCVSFHMRTMIPSQCPEDRDNLMESVTPLNQWGKQFVSVQFNRKKGTTNQGDGDLFRIISSEDNTNVHCDIYDIKSNKKIAQRDAVLNKAGSFFDLDDIQVISDKNKLTSIRGTAVWTSDKPIMLMQYAFSNKWDDDSRWAPLQVLVTPVEQYVSSFVLNTPIVADFNQNELTLYAIGDPNDPNSELIKSVSLDGKEIYKTNSSFVANQIIGTNIYWVRLSIDAGTHRIESKTKVSGYLCGFASSDCYGYVVGLGTKILDKYDVSPPKIKITGTCGNYTVEATETNNSPEGSVPMQADQGIRRIVLLDSSSSNYHLTLKDPDKFLPQYIMARQTFYLNPINRAIPGKATFAILDKAGNYTIDSVYFIPDSIKLQSNVLDFSNVRVNSTKILDFKISNIGSGMMHIASVKFRNNQFFVLNDPAIQNGFSIPPFSDTTIKINYTPKTETVDKQDWDSLLITGQCSNFAVFLEGKGIMPHIQVEDNDFGKIEVNKEVCLEDINKTGLKINNTGTDVLTIKAIENISAPFFISNASPELPFTIPPGGTVSFKSICFFASDSGQYSMDGIIRSDSGDDSIFTIKATAFKKEDSVQSVETPDKISHNMEIYPNPSNEEFVNIKYYISGYSLSNIELFDMNGNLCFTIDSGMKQEGIYEKVFSTNQLESGIYYIKMNSGNKFEVKRLVVIK